MAGDRQLRTFGRDLVGGGARRQPRVGRVELPLRVQIGVEDEALRFRQIAGAQRFPDELSADLGMEPLGNGTVEIVDARIGLAPGVEIRTDNGLSIPACYTCRR